MPTSAPSKRAPYCTASNASLTSAELALRKAAKKAAKLAHREGRERRRLKNMERVDFGGVTGVTSAPEAATPDTVALRDDMGNVYSHAPAPLIAAVRKHINELTRFLLEDPGYTADRGESQRNAMILLDKMKKGVQNSADFGMPGAVWGEFKRGSHWKSAREHVGERSARMRRCSDAPLLGRTAARTRRCSDAPLSTRRSPRAAPRPCWRHPPNPLL